MVASPQIIDRQTALERTFAAAFHALDETRDAQVVAHLYEFIVKHVRSAAPMSLLGAADVIEPTAEVIVPLQDGARIDLNVDDGSLVLYVVEPSGKDAAVALSVGRTEDLRRGLSRILASAGVR